MKHPRPHGVKKEERTHFDRLLWAMQKNNFFYLGLDGTKILFIFARRWVNFGTQVKNHVR